MLQFVVVGVSFVGELVEVVVGLIVAQSCSSCRGRSSYWNNCGMRSRCNNDIYLK